MLLTLKDNTIVHYITNKNYNQKFEKGIKYDDPKYKVKWPFRPKNIFEGLNVALSYINLVI